MGNRLKRKIKKSKEGLSAAGYRNKTQLTKSGQKVFVGCEHNHARHPELGIPWCELCKRERRANCK